MLYSMNPAILDLLPRNMVITAEIVLLDKQQSQRVAQQPLQYQRHHEKALLRAHFYWRKLNLSLLEVQTSSGVFRVGGARGKTKKGGPLMTSS